MKKEGCEWPLSEAKAPERPLFSRMLSHKTVFFFYFPFSAESLGIYEKTLAETIETVYTDHVFGELAQLVERLVRNQ